MTKKTNALSFNHFTTLDSNLNQILPLKYTEGHHDKMARTQKNTQNNTNVSVSLSIQRAHITKYTIFNIRIN